MSFPRYPKYKASGVEWLGDVPEGWEVKRFRFCVRSSNAGEVIDRSYWHSGDELFFSCQRDAMSSNFSEFPLWKRTSDRDLLVTRNATPYVHTPPANSIYSNVVQRCILNDGLLRSFVALSLETVCSRLREDGYGVSIPSFSYEKWCNLHLALPPLPEQTAIAEFLDRETGKIDGLVTEQRHLIDLLKEKRQAVISHAVTKGLNPHAKMKPSGIEWLGDVPEGWGFKPLKHLGSIISGFAFKSTDFKPQGVRVLKIANIQTRVIDWSDDSYLPDDFYDKHIQFAVKDGDVVFALTRPIISTGLKAAIANIGSDRVLLNQRNAIFRPSEWLNKKFLYYILFCDSFKSDFLNRIDFTGLQPNISPVDISNIKVLFPSTDDQSAIAKFLDFETAEFDTLTTEAQQVIDLLQERRTALISAAVTGQIDVRNQPSKGKP